MKLCWLVCCEVLALASLVLYHWPHLLWGVSSSFASVAFSISCVLDKQFRCYTQVFKFESELVFLKQEQGIIWKQVFPLGHLTKIFIVKHHLSFHPPGVSCMGRNNRWEMDWGGNSSPSLTEIISCIVVIERNVRSHATVPLNLIDGRLNKYLYLTPSQLRLWLILITGGGKKNFEQ